METADNMNASDKVKDPNTSTESILQDTDNGRSSSQVPAEHAPGDDANSHGNNESITGATPLTEGDTDVPIDVAGEDSIALSVVTSRFRSSHSIGHNREGRMQIEKQFKQVNFQIQGTADKNYRQLQWVSIEPSEDVYEQPVDPGPLTSDIIPGLDASIEAEYSADLPRADPTNVTLNPDSDDGNTHRLPVHELIKKFSKVKPTEVNKPGVLPGTVHIAGLTRKYQPATTSGLATGRNTSQSPTKMASPKVPPKVPKKPTMLKISNNQQSDSANEHASTDTGATDKVSDLENNSLAMAGYAAVTTIDEKVDGVAEKEVLDKDQSSDIKPSAHANCEKTLTAHTGGENPHSVPVISVQTDDKMSIIDSEDDLKDNDDTHSTLAEAESILDLCPGDNLDINDYMSSESLPNINIASRPGSLPIINIEADYNANMIPGNKRAVSYQPIHLTPRRDGRITLPKRYLQLLNEYKKKRSSRVPSDKDSDNSQDSLASQDSDSSARCNAKNEWRLNTCRLTDTNTDRLSSMAVLNSAEFSGTWSDRVEDLDLAVKWIRQEVLQIKQEDRFLTRRLLDLRARIHQLHGIPAHLSLSSSLAVGACGSENDVATWNSFLSLDERVLSRSNPLMNKSTVAALKEILLSYQNRTEAFERKKTGTLSRGLRGFGTDSRYTDSLSRSVSTREAIRPPTRIRRKNSLPMQNELEEDHFFSGESDSD